MSNVKQKTLDKSRVDAPFGHVGMFNGDVGASDPKTLLVRWLKEFFGNDCVFVEQFPIADSYATMGELSVVVQEVDDNTIADNCKGVFNNMVVDVVIYQRKECQIAGDLKLIDNYLTATIDSLVGTYNFITIFGARRDDAKPVRFIESNFRGRRITFILDYAFNK